MEPRENPVRRLVDEKVRHQDMRRCEFAPRRVTLRILKALVGSAVGVMNHDQAVGPMYFVKIKKVTNLYIYAVQLRPAFEQTTEGITFLVDNVYKVEYFARVGEATISLKANR